LITSKGGQRKVFPEVEGKRRFNLWIEIRTRTKNENDGDAYLEYMRCERSEKGSKP